MENLGFIILNIVVLGCFLAFFVSTYCAFEKVERKGVVFKEKCYFSNIILF